MHQIQENTAETQSNDTVSLRELFDPLFRHRILLLTSFIVLSTLALAFLLLRGKQYESHMQVLVNRERQDPVVSSGAATNNGGMIPQVTEEEINSEAELLRSQDVLQEVVVRNGLQNRSAGSLFGAKPGSASEAERIQKAETRLEKNLKVKIIPKSNILDVSYTSNDPRLAHAVLESLATLYIDKHVSLYSAPGSYSFFDKETTVYRQAMNDAEARLRELDRTGSTAAPDLEREGMAQQVTLATGTLNTMAAEVAADENRLETDRALVKQVKPRTDSAKSSAPPSYLLQELGSDLLKAKTRRAQLAAKYKEGYPLLTEADQEVAIAQNAFDQAQKTQYLTENTDRNPIYEYLQQDLAKTEADLAGHRGALIAGQSSIANLQQKVLSLDEASLNRTDLLREIKTNEDSYLLYLGKREQQRASEALDKMRIANVAIAVPPSLPAVPASGLLLPLLTSLVISLILSILLAYVVAYFDPSFHEPKEVSEQLGVPFVVAVGKKAA